MPAPNIIAFHVSQMEYQRGRTLGLLEQIEKHPAGEKALGWRPGPGRAHIAWQLMHGPSPLVCCSGNSSIPDESQMS